MTDPSQTILELQAEVLEAVAVGEDLTSCLSRLCGLVEGLVPDSIASTMLLGADSDALFVAAAPRLSPDVCRMLDGLVPSDLAGSCGTAVYQRRPVFVGDTARDPRWEPLRGLARSLGISACWSVPIFSRSGEVLGSFAISHSVCRLPTEPQERLLRSASQLAGIAIHRNRQEEALRASERKYQDLFENAPDMFVSADAATGRILTCNRTLLETLGFERSDVIGRRVVALYGPRCQDELRRVQARFLEMGEASSEDLRLVRRDGSTLDVSLKITAIRDEQGEIRSCRSVWRDVTDRKRTEEAVRQAQKLESIGVLASGIAHDFNNLLAGILGNAQLARTRSSVSPEVDRALAQIEQAGLRAAEMVRQLLAYAGRGKGTLETLDLGRLAEETTALLPSATRARVELRTGGVSATIRGDATQVGQVLMNLITNAVDASEASAAPIVVRSGTTRAEAEDLADCLIGREASPGRYAFLEVEDAGCGMDRETLERIFDPFFTTKTNGRGLGLAATQGIVRGHAGALAVSSAPGRGTTFRLLCPLAEEVAGDGSTSGPQHVPIEGAIVLVVDDDALVLDVTEGLLRHAGCRVVTASSGAEALELVRGGQRLDLVMLDVTMPGMSGQRTFEAIREARPGLPVVFCSGQDPEDYAHHVGSGALTAALPKPFSRTDLCATLGALLESAEGR